MKLLPVLLILVLAAAAVCAGCTGPQAPGVTPATATPAPSPVPEDTARMASVARNLSAAIDTELTDLRSGLKNTSSVIATADLSSPEAESALSDNLLRYPWAVSSVIIDTGGTIRAAVPKNYAGIVGKDVSDDESLFPPFDEVLFQCREMRRSTLALLESFSEEDLDHVSAKAPEGHEETFGTYRLCLQFVADHWYMHRGQLADARRAAGLERMWF